MTRAVNRFTPPTISHTASSRFNVSRSATLAIAVQVALMSLSQAAHAADDLQTLDSVVVTAQKRAEKIQDVPAAVTAISGDDIGRGNLLSTKDIAALVPSATGWNTESRARPRFFIRGIGSNEATNNAVNSIGFYADEVYYGNNLFQGGPLFDLDRVEVLRGPQGTLWGKNTTGGAFHFVSKQPSFVAGGYGTVNLGNYGEKIAEAAYGGALYDDVLAGRLAVHYEDRDGFATNTVTGNEVGGIKDIAVRGQVLALVSDRLDALLNVHLRHFDGSQTPWYSITPNGAPDSFGYVSPYSATGDREHVAYNASDLPIKLESKGATATVNWSLNDSLRLTSITAVETGQRTTQSDADYTLNEVSRAYSDNSVRQLSQELRLASDKSGPFSWITGLYFFRDDNNSFAATATLPGTTTPAYYYTTFTQKTRSKAVFGSATYAVTERFKINAGLRFTSETSGIDLITRRAAPNPVRFNPAVNWWQPESVTSPLVTYAAQNEEHTWSNLGCDLTPEYRLDDNQLVYFRHASGFRSGNYNASVTPPSSVPSVVNPEKLKSYEFGYKSTWFDQRLIFNTSVFYYDYKNMQLTVNQVINNVFIPTLQNAGAGEVKGIEVELQAQATRDLRLKANLSSLKTKFKQFTSGGIDYAGYNFARVPNETASFAADYRVPQIEQGSVLLSADARYTGKTNFNATNNTDPLALQEAFWLGNVRATYTFPGDRLSVGLYVNNVTDRFYKIQAMLLSNGQYRTAFGDPRTYGVTATARF